MNKRPSMNTQEAGAFAVHCYLRGLSTAEALAEMVKTTWPSSADHRSHTPTIRRLAKPLLLALDGQHAAARVAAAARAEDRARWLALPETAKAEIRAAVAAAPATVSNKAARNIANRHGITVHAETIDTLRSLVDPRNQGNI